MKLTLLERLLAERMASRPTALITHLPTGQQSLLCQNAFEGTLDLSSSDRDAIRQALDEGRSQTLELSLGKLFVDVWQPPLRLIVVGAVHIAQALATMATATGYRLTIVDPRTTFATKDRFPDAELITEWPDDAVTALHLDYRSALVTLTHDSKLDDPALLVGLKSPAFYIGALGSRRSHAKRIDRLVAAGASLDQVRHIRGPVGLAIGALSPAEIAVSILAEITAALHRSPLAERPIL